MDNIGSLVCSAPLCPRTDLAAPPSTSLIVQVFSSGRVVRAWEMVIGRAVRLATAVRSSCSREPGHRAGDRAD